MADPTPAAGGAPGARRPGLPTAKRLIGIHRGRISVECPPAGGTIVTIELPLG